jgi:hypothetical protein
MIYTYEINGIPLQTGDIICTMDGKPDVLPGQFWRLVGKLVPGDVDHIAIYLGPEGRCVEAGALGVTIFEGHDGLWDAEHTMPERGLLVDTFYGAVYPLNGLQLSEEEEARMRMTVADYCLAHLGRPYNINFLDSETDRAFYCSQLAYKAYQQVGINLNTGMEMEHLPGTNLIIFPQEIWNGCAHRVRGQ